MLFEIHAQKPQLEVVWTTCDPIPVVLKFTCGSLSPSPPLCWTPTQMGSKGDLANTLSDIQIIYMKYIKAQKTIITILTILKRKKPFFDSLVTR